MSDITCYLAFFTLFAKVICIVKNRRPIETTFKYLMSRSFFSKMPTPRMRMKKSENGMKFILWNTSPNYLIHKISTDKKCPKNNIQHQLVTCLFWNLEKPGGNSLVTKQFTKSTYHGLEEECNTYNCSSGNVSYCFSLYIIGPQSA